MQLIKTAKEPGVGTQDNPTNPMLIHTDPTHSRN